MKGEADATLRYRQISLVLCLTSDLEKLRDLSLAPPPQLPITFLPHCSPVGQNTRNSYLPLHQPFPSLSSGLRPIKYIYIQALYMCQLSCLYIVISFRLVAALTRCELKKYLNRLVRKSHFCFDNSQGKTFLHSNPGVSIASSHQIRAGSEGAGLRTDSKTYSNK